MKSWKWKNVPRQVIKSSKARLRRPHHTFKFWNSCTAVVETIVACIWLSHWLGPIVLSHQSCWQGSVKLRWCAKYVCIMPHVATLVAIDHWRKGNKRQEEAIDLHKLQACKCEVVFFLFWSLFCSFYVRLCAVYTLSEWHVVNWKS